MEQNQKKSSNLPPMFSLSVRILVAAYVLYLAYGLFQNLGSYEGSRKYVFLFTAVVFTVISCVLLFFSIKAYIKGAYVGGKLDITQTEEAQAQKDVLLAQEENENNEPNRKNMQQKKQKTE